MSRRDAVHLPETVRPEGVILDLRGVVGVHKSRRNCATACGGISMTRFPKYHLNMRCIRLTPEGQHSTNSTWWLEIIVAERAGVPHPNYRHGLRTKEMQEVRQMISFLSKGARELS